MRTNARSPKELAAFEAPDVSSLRGYKARSRASRLIAIVADNDAIHDELRPYITEASEWLEATAGQVAGLTSVAGPIELAALSASALQYAWARYWMAQAVALGPLADRKDVECASRMLDAAKNNAFAALELAARTARALGQRGNADPLDDLTSDTQQAAVADSEPSECVATRARTRRGSDAG